MDPTMQSPSVFPSSPHFYPVKNWVGSVLQGNTPQQAFAALSSRATPFQSKPSIDGGTINIPGFGPVRQLVDPDHLTIVNTTLPGHIAHPGNVFRSIVQEGDDLYVVTHGYGTGIFPRLNEVAAPPTWWSTDLGIRRELNPYTLLGYPMDEMNAPAGIGGQPQAAPSGSASNGALGSGMGNSFAGGMDRAGPTPPESVDRVFDSSSNRPVRYLARKDGRNSPASAPGVATDLFAPADGLYPREGLADWLASLARADRIRY